MTVRRRTGTDRRTTLALLGVAAAVVLALVPELPSTSQAAVGTVAYVAGNPQALTVHEQFVVDRMEATGQVVTILDDTTVTPASVASADLVLVGFSVSPGTLRAKLAQVPTAVWVAKPKSFPRFQMTGPVAGTDYGDKPGRTWAVTAPAHPLAAGRTETVTAYTASRRVSWALPVAGASVVATAGGSATVFTVPAGATLADGSVGAGCRYSFPLFARAPTAMTADGLAMFDAAVEWGVSGCGAGPVVPPDPPEEEDGINHVVVVSIDGLNPEALAMLGPAGAPTIHQLLNEGVSTLNARSAYDKTQTLPNHLSMVTGRKVALPGGHGVTFNKDDKGTVHETAGQYVASVFDVVHDHGGSTALYAGKPKFGFLNRSWNATYGAPDTVGPDNGRDKIDEYLRVTTGSASTAALVSDIGDGTLRDLTVFHLAEPDAAGHASEFLSPDYLAAVGQADGYLGQIVDALDGSATYRDHTVLVLTSDHGGGIGKSHTNASAPVNYTIPFLAWGPEVPPGEDLYALNPTRLDPGTGRPADDATPSPVRNGDVANLVLDLLDLPAVPGSTYAPGQDLRLAP